MTERLDLDVQFAGRIEAIDKRVKRLETLESLSFAGGGWTEIETYNVSGLTEDGITIQDIPALFLHLMVIINSRTDEVPRDTLSMRMNNDSGNNYWYQYGQINDGVGCLLHCTASFTALTDQIRMAHKPGPGWLGEELYDDVFGVCNVWIPDYRNQYKYKSVSFDNFLIVGETAEIPATIRRVWGGGVWRSKTVINRLDFLNRFVKNSKISVYGIGGTFEEFA